MEQVERSMLGSGGLRKPAASLTLAREHAPLALRSRDPADEREPGGPRAEASPRHKHRDGLHVLLPSAIFGGGAILLAADLLSDFHAGHGPAHFFFELGVGALALVGVALFARHAWGVHGLADDLERALRASETETSRWQAQARQALDGLGVAIDRHFTRWNLTDAERSVALMLLQGLSHREIAAQRGTNEGTTRHQALAIYRKTGLAGRSGLAAFVLEGLALAERPPSREE